MGGIVDQSLGSGMNDFFFVQKDETDLTYNYYGFTDDDGVILIMRMPKDGNSALYWAGIGAFAAVWAVKDGKSYVVPTELKAPKV